MLILDVVVVFRSYLMLSLAGMASLLWWRCLHTSMTTAMAVCVLTVIRTVCSFKMTEMNAGSLSFIALERSHTRLIMRTYTKIAVRTTSMMWWPSMFLMMMHLMRSSPSTDAKATTTLFSESFKFASFSKMQILLLCEVTPLVVMMMVVAMMMPAILKSISSAHF
jgi:hypothetical protein